MGQAGRQVATSMHKRRAETITGGQWDVGGGMDGQIKSHHVVECGHLSHHKHRADDEKLSATQPPLQPNSFDCWEGVTDHPSRLETSVK